MTCEEFTHDDGAYLLGALEPTERRRYEAHLAGCAACRAGLDEIAELPAVLAAVRPEDVLALSGPVPPADAATEPPPDTLLPRLLREVTAARRRRRSLAVAGALVAACVAALIVVLVTTSGSGQGAPRAGARELTPLESTPVEAYARLAAHGSGTRIELTCEDHGTHGGRLPYSMTVVDADGRRRTLSSWDIGPGQRVTYTADTVVPRERLRAVELTVPGGRTILRLRV